MSTVQQRGSRSMLSETHPQIASEFVHCMCNGTRCEDHTPANTTRGSHRKFRWQCPQGHAYDAKVGSRASGQRTTGCAECSGASRPGSHPALAVSHPTLHARVLRCVIDDCTTCDRDTVTAGNNCRWSFRCDAGHEYQAWMYNAVRGTASCQRCSRELLADSDIADEFVMCACDECLEGVTEHHQGTLTTGSGRPVVWQCRGCANQWPTRIPDRLDPVYPTGCPQCAPKTESRRERDVMTALAGLLATEYDGPVRVTGWDYPVDFADLDRRLVVQYDARYWHASRTDVDTRCNAALTSSGWTVVRVRELGLASTGTLEVPTTPHEPSSVLASRIAAALGQC